MNPATCSPGPATARCAGPKLTTCDVPGTACMTGKEGSGTRPHAGSGVPKVGDWIYTPTRMSISHGQDDVRGGLAQVTKVEFCPQYNGGNHRVEVAQVSRAFFWEQIMDEQARLREQFGTSLAFDDPDYHDYGPDDGWQPAPGSVGRGGWQSLPGRGNWP